MGAHIQLRARAADVGDDDLAGQAGERAGRSAGDAQDRQGQRTGVARQVRGRPRHGGHRQVHLRRQQRLLTVYIRRPLTRTCTHPRHHCSQDRHC